MNDQGPNSTTVAAAPDSPLGASRPSPLAPDLDRYRRHIAHLGLSAEREAAMILAVWQIMRSFVDRAFGDDPVQLACKAGDEVRLSREVERLPVIGSDDQATTGDKKPLSGAFGRAVDGKRRKEKQ